MHTRYFISFAFHIFIPEIFAQDKILDRPEWKEFFDKHEATGTILIVDSRASAEKVSVYDRTRAGKRYSPASTFKVPHTLFALDAGVVKDEFQVFPWDGVKEVMRRTIKIQNLRSAMRHSALWVYEKFAKAIGEEKARSYLSRISYGNMDPSTKGGAYWVDGKLAISAEEQVVFLKKLYQNDLPFELEHQRLLKDVMIVEAERLDITCENWMGGRHGWWVGWVEWSAGPVFFALNIDTPNRWEDL